MSADNVGRYSVGRQRWTVCRGFNIVSHYVYRPTVAYGVYGVVIGNCSIMGILRFASLYFCSLSHIDSDVEQVEFVTSSPNIKSFDSCMTQNVGQLLTVQCCSPKCNSKKMDLT